MSKISLLQKEKKRFYLFNKYFNKLNLLKSKIKHNKNDFNKNFNLRLKMQDFPRNCHATRIRNRCFITGRPRGVFRRFGLSRFLIKDLSCKGEIPGIFKISW